MTEQATLIDTNLIVYAHDQSAAPDKRKKADALIESLWGNGFVTVQILGEVYRVLAEKKKTDARQAADVVTDFSDGFTVLETRKQDVRHAVRMACEKGVPIFDALIASTAMRHGVYRILTEDVNGFSKIKELNVQNPI